MNASQELKSRLQKRGRKPFGHETSGFFSVCNNKIVDVRLRLAGATVITPYFLDRLAKTFRNLRRGFEDAVAPKRYAYKREKDEHGVGETKFRKRRGITDITEGMSALEVGQLFNPRLRRVLGWCLASILKPLLRERGVTGRMLGANGFNTARSQFVRW